MSEPPKKKNVKRSPKLSVKLLQEQIDAARQRDSGYCMLAEAIKAAFPDASKVSVDLQTIRFSDARRRLRYVYLTPRSCQVALVAFDQGVEVAPFEFRLRGAQVTTMRPGDHKSRAILSPEQLEKRKAAKRRTASLAPEYAEGAKSVPDKIGGHAPPLQKLPDGVPFSRRREFGIRALSR
jgi:hypothetical protein